MFKRQECSGRAMRCEFVGMSDMARAIWDIQDVRIHRSFLEPQFVERVVATVAPARLTHCQPVQDREAASAAPTLNLTSTL